MAGFVLLRSNGRLGNQLIELLAVSSLYPDKKIVAIDFDSARSYLNRAPIFCWIGSTCSYGPVARALAKLFWLVRQLDNRLINIVFSIVEETNDNLLRTIPAKINFFGLTWINGPYFQNTQYLDLSRLRSFEASKHILCESSEFIRNSTKVKDYNLMTNVFVHVRLGDYLTACDVSNGASYALPPEYYLNALRLLLAKFTHCCRIYVASDDIQRTKLIFKEFPNCIFIDESPELTLTILSLCDAGVLSASSFSWWAAHIASTLYNRSGPFLAPMHWLGHSINEWYPAGFNSHVLNYID